MSCSVRRAGGEQAQVLRAPMSCNKVAVEALGSRERGISRVQEIDVFSFRGKKSGQGDGSGLGNDAETSSRQLRADWEAERSAILADETVNEAARHELIAVGAYYRAQKRGFAPGRELDDWLAAEAELARSDVGMGQ